MLTSALAAEYLEMVGYNPFADDPTITAKEVAETLDEIWNIAIDVAATAGDEAQVEKLMLAQGVAFCARFA